MASYFLLLVPGLALAWPDSAEDLALAAVHKLGGRGDKTWVCLSACEVKDIDLKQVSRLTGLHTLRLAATYVTDKGLKDLARLKQLQELGLGNNKISDEGIKELASLSNLLILDLQNTKITDAGLRELA